ncbi:hypothetical protein BDV97DRAFT_47300 [Delphinella strobiligena]|nr:hypothetical protein BDV97DRAFT_47300 [Delphinella strobiligena]
MAPFAAMDGKAITKPHRLSLGTSEIYRSDSPSSSPSPSRHKRNSSNSYDLLRDLSPTTTLRAFTAASSSSAGNSSDQLVRSIESASSSERLYGARIAQTCKDIRAWHEEVQNWEWPGTFEEPLEADKTAKRKHMVREDFSIPPSDGSTVDMYIGCLPLEIVCSCEKRVEEIRDAVEELDVEDLKNHVLNAHAVAQDDYTTSTPQRLDDFTALITATILQALPFLSRLNRLLNTWSVRLCVLRKVPAYLRELQEVKQEIEDGWSSMTRDIQNGQIEGDTLRSIYDTLHNRLGKRVFRLGARLDSVLDDLEGREETLPEHWINAFETLETDYGEWVVQTERELMSRDLSLTERAVVKPTATDPKPESAIGLGVIFDRHDGGVAKTTTGMSRANSKDTLSPDDQFSAQLELAESPVLGHSNSTQFRDGDDEGTDSDDEPSLPSEQITGHRSARISVPPLPEVDLSRSSSIQRDRPLNPSSASTSSAPSPLRPRHIPIVIPDLEQKEAVNLLPTRSASSNRVSPSGDLTKGPAINNVRARAAFLNRGLEQTQTLQKSVNSPVRPFEHASQAFTKLFARANSAQHSVQHSRSSSASSRGSSSLRKSLSTKRDLGYPLDASTTLSSSLQSVQDNPIPIELDANPATDHKPSAQNNYPDDSPSVAELPTRDDFVTAEASMVSGADSSEQSHHLKHSSSTAELPGRDAFVTPDTQYGFEPSTVGSRSTIESAWASPAFSDLPENWPLTGRLPNGDEISSPRKPIEADCFEKMFVDSLPASPQATRSGVLGVTSVITDIPKKYERLHSKKTSLDTGLPVQDVTEPSQHHQRSGSPHVPFISEGGLSVDTETLAEATTPGSSQSNLSTPEVYSASAAGYFMSKEITTPPPPVTRTSSASTKKHSNEKGGHDSHKAESQPTSRRASVASTENHPRSEVISTVRMLVKSW